MTELSLCSVDVIPAKCGVEAEITEGMVRFRASRLRVSRLRRKAKPAEVSQWSGWFSLGDAPIALTWKAFEWSDSPSAAKDPHGLDTDEGG